MNVFGQPGFDDHEEVLFVSDDASGLRAIIAIHTTAPFGFSGGGCRAWAYADEAAALTDALRLSRAMTYKHALADMPGGGAKAVVLLDGRRRREDLWRALGRVVESLGGRYIMGADVGTSPDEMRLVGEETRYVVGRRADSAPMTARGALVGLRVAVRRRLKRESLAGLRVAVQGAGKVGAELCRLLAEEGAALWICDLDRARAARLARALGASAVEPEDIYDLDVDVLSPCALAGALNDATIPRLRCAVVAGAANNQLGDAARHGAALARRGILYAPDFVIGMGGMLMAAQEGLDLASDVPRPIDEALVRAQVDRIGPILEAIFERAGDGSTDAAAAALAIEKRRAMGAPAR